MINEDWHRAHPMPDHPSEAERLAWHADHARECGCREAPARFQKRLAKIRREDPGRM